MLWRGRGGWGGLQLPGYCKLVELISKSSSPHSCCSSSSSSLPLMPSSSSSSSAANAKAKAKRAPDETAIWAEEHADARAALLEVMRKELARREVEAAEITTRPAAVPEPSSPRCSKCGRRSRSQRECNRCGCMTCVNCGNNGAQCPCYDEYPDSDGEMTAAEAKRPRVE